MLFSSLKLAYLATFSSLLFAAVEARPTARQHQLASRGYRAPVSTVNHGVKVAPNLVSSSYRKAKFTSNHKRACNTTTPAPVPEPEPVPEEPAKPVVPDFPETFNNPIKPGGGADPWVIYSKENDLYYLCQSQQGGLVVTPSQDLAVFPEEGPVVWTPPAELKNLWAPELHWLDGAWYIYVAMDDGNNANHRMYVLKGTSTDPTQPFDLAGKISSSDDNWAIDGTVMQYEGALYFVWSGWPNPDAGFPQNLYLAKMCSPTEICSERTLIHEPSQAWQKEGDSGVNEGPTALENNGRHFIVYSAAGSWGDNYSLALMGIEAGSDPLVASNWWALDDRPVMWRNDEQGVYAPGHASFVNDRSGTPYVVYHAIDNIGAGWGGRTIRTEPFQWNADGSPWFPRPNGFGVAISHPQ